MDRAASTKRKSPAHGGSGGLGERLWVPGEPRQQGQVRRRWDGRAAAGTALGKARGCQVRDSNAQRQGTQIVFIKERADVPFRVKKV